LRRFHRGKAQLRHPPLSSTRQLEDQLRTAADEHPSGVFDPVEGADRDLGRLEDGDALAVHVLVAAEEGGGAQRGQAATDELGGHLVHCFGLAGTSECFIAAAAVVYGPPLSKAHL